MPDISSIGHSPVGPLEWHAAPAARREVQPEHVTGGRPPVRPGDTVELSEHARFLDMMHRLPAVRNDRIESVRLAIAEGRYETPAKLDAAVERLIDDALRS
jgi:anti-sigma28 factor (negative regulator of flagellin synthesis)